MSNRGSKLNFGIVLGALIGGAAAYFLSPRNGKENREILKKKMNEFNTMLEEGEVTNRVREIYGEFSEQGRKTYMMARQELDTRMSNVKGSLSDVDQEKYKAMVDDVLNRVREETQESKERLTQLGDYLMKTFHLAKEEAESDASDVKKEVKKAATSPKSDKKVN